MGHGTPAMNAILFRTAAPERLGMVSDEAKSDRLKSDGLKSDGLKFDRSWPDKPSDAAWMVLEAANDLRDDATVEACRRVIDANLSGALASQSDLHVVSDYFR
jgi:hypothetical protein